MFDKEIYTKRRNALREKVGNGVILLPGNNESPMNYPSNTYHFRQDSSFLYFFGLDHPGFVAVCDPETGSDVLYGNDLDIDDIIWMGEQPSVKDLAEKAGVEKTKPLSSLKEDIEAALAAGRRVHILPPYRGEHDLFLSDVLGTSPAGVKDFISQELIMAVISLREVKDDQEIVQIEQAIDTAWKMHTTVMKRAFPGIREYDIAGEIEGIALSGGGPVSFPVILSMDGQTLHNHSHDNLLREGRLLLTDAGCETAMHYASDITRTVPVGGRFGSRQKEIYGIVLEANTSAIGAMKPGITNLEVHLLAARIIAEGLKRQGLMKGDIEEAVNLGAHALFFPHGLGHMMGLDVHDMEGLGEDNVGYDANVKRSDQFGTAYLRLGKKLREGFVVTVEPGIYFIPALIDLWKSQNKFADYINYPELDKYRDFGGIRIEDDVLVTSSGHRVLGKPIPKTIAEIEDTVRQD